jgi:Protein of unknown function (DUF4054)
VSGASPPVTTPLPLTLAQFRETYGTAFRDRDRYPDGIVQAYLNLAAALLNACLWADQLQLGLYLFTAHNLALEDQANRQAEAGTTPGTTVGPVSSKSVGGVSVSYDVSSGIEPGDSHWGSTTYGRRFLHLCKLVGMGGLQIGGEAPIPGSWFPGSAAWYV